MSDEPERKVLPFSLPLLPKLATDALKLSAFARLGANAKAAADSDGAVALIRGLARSTFGNRVVKTKAIQSIAFASVTGATAMAVTVPCDMVLISDFSNFLNLFDEMRCESFHTKAFVGLSASSAAVAISGNAMVAMHFDPVDQAAPTSIAESQHASVHTDPVCAWQSTPANIATSNFVSSLPACASKGYLELHSGKLTVDILPANSGGVVAPSPVCGNWIGTSTGAAVVGYMKLYGENPASPLAWWYRLFHYLNLEFRFRG